MSAGTETATTATSATAMVDLQQIYADIARLTVPRLKDVLRALHQRVSGNRADLVERLRCECLRRAERTERLAEARIAVARALAPPTIPSTPTTTPTPASVLPASVSAVSSASHQQYHGMLSGGGLASSAVSTNSHHSHHSHMRPSPLSMSNSGKSVFSGGGLSGGFGGMSGGLGGVGSVGFGGSGVDGLRFRTAPFYVACDGADARLLAKMTPCSTGRDMLRFSVPAQVLARLSSQVSGSASNVLLLLVGPASGVSMRKNPFKMSGVPIEYPILDGPHSNAPNHCSIVVNNTSVPPAEYAGIRGKPWTAKPLELNKFLHKSPSQVNTIDLKFTPMHDSPPSYIAVVVQLATVVSLPDIVLQVKQDAILFKDAILAESIYLEF